MANVLPSQLMQSVLGNLYDVLVNGDGKVTPPSEDNFLSWCSPGIPYDENQLEFLEQGFSGKLKQAEIDKFLQGEKRALTPEERNELIAQDTTRMYLQAEMFSRLVDFIPDVANKDNHLARLVMKNDEGSLSDVYEEVLKMSQVVKTELDDKTKEKIEKFRALLSVEKENLLGEMVTVPSPLVDAYTTKMQEYEAAVIAYNEHRINALVAKDPQAVHYWKLNGKTLENRVKSSMAAWISSGFKKDYEGISAFIDQVMSRDLTLLKADYKHLFETAGIKSEFAGDFLPTFAAPANFPKAGGWTTFTFNQSHFNSYSNSKSNRWGGGGGFSLGIFSIGGKAGGKKDEFSSGFDSSKFSLSFQMCQVPIIRPWFKRNFIASNYWRYDKKSPSVANAVLSDGGNPPKGKMVAYPTSIVFIRNLELKFAENTGFSNWMKKEIDGGGGISIGPFFAGGSYGASSSQSVSNYTHNSQSVKVPGMQIIGFKCHVLPKSPNPNPTIKESSWV
jgi:hypothetical protein